MSECSSRTWSLVKALISNRAWNNGYVDATAVLASLISFARICLNIELELLAVAPALLAQDSGTISIWLNANVSRFRIAI